MIKVLDLEDSLEHSDDTDSGKVRKQNTSATEKHQSGKTENGDDTCTSKNQNKNTILTGSSANSEEHSLDAIDKKSKTLRGRKGSRFTSYRRDETLGWFTGACHIWHSSEDKAEEIVQNNSPVIAAERKGLWPRLSSANFFGINSYKNIEGSSSNNQGQKESEKSKYFWQLQNQKQCECQSNLKRESSLGKIFGWASVGFNGGSSITQTPVMEFRKDKPNTGDVENF